MLRLVRKRDSKEPTLVELRQIGESILGQGLKYDRGEVKLAQEIACLKEENRRLRLLLRKGGYDCDE